MNTNKVRNGFFQTEDGDNSITRLISFMAFIAAVGFGYLTIKVPTVNTDLGFWVTFLFLTYSLGQKTFQKAVDAFERFQNRPPRPKKE